MHFNDLKLLLNTQMIWTIFIKALKNTTQLKNVKYLLTKKLSNKKFNPIVTELFIKGRKLNICLIFIAQSYFTVPKNIRLNSAH